MVFCKKSVVNSTPLLRRALYSSSLLSQKASMAATRVEEVEAGIGECRYGNWKNELELKKGDGEGREEGGDEERRIIFGFELRLEAIELGFGGFDFGIELGLLGIEFGSRLGHRMLNSVSTRAVGDPHSVEEIISDQNDVTENFGVEEAKAQEIVNVPMCCQVLTPPPSNPTNTCWDTWVPDTRAGILSATAGLLEYYYKPRHQRNVEWWAHRKGGSADTLLHLVSPRFGLERIS
ncbi:hypothetical protein ACLB2K_068308 [Fragaria x ananassa]